MTKIIILGSRLQSASLFLAMSARNDDHHLIIPSDPEENKEKALRSISSESTVMALN
jgi:hypothetical protein